MGRKRNPYIQLFTRDILSSPRCRALSESAAGVYLFLLCRLNEPPTPGAYRISDWELHPTWKRSKTQQCLATPYKYERLPYFAAMLSKNDLPWKQAAILAGLQELYKYGIVTVEGDMLVQPRMYKDNGFELPDLDNDGDPVGTILDDPTSGSMALRGDDDFTQNNCANNGAEKRTDLGTKKVQGKVRVSHAGATRALRVENMSNNINNSKGNKGVQGGVTPVKPKTQENNPKGENRASGGEKKSGTDNLSSDAQKRADSPKNGSDGQKIPVADCPPTLSEVQDYMQSRGEAGDPFRHITAEQFYDEGCMSGWTIRGGQPLYDWRARLRSLEGYRRKNGEPTVTQEGYVTYRDGKLVGTLAVRTNNNKGYEGSRNNQRGATRSQGGHTEGDDGMLQQSVRIISRLRASREAESSDSTDSNGDPF